MHSYSPSRLLSWLAAIAVVIALPVSHAHAAALEYPVDTNIALGANTYVILAASKATSLVVGSTTITVTVAAGDTFTLRSNNRHILANDLDLVQYCTAGENTLVVSGAKTVVITPSTTACSSIAGGGGGGGGGSAPVPSPTPSASPSPTPSPSSQPVSPFTDIIGHFSRVFVERLYGMGVVQGKSPTEFRPDDKITRAEMVKIALLTFAYDVDAEGEGAVPFTDVEPGAWYARYAAAARNAGIAFGYEDGSFRPNAPVKRSEALKMILLAARKDTSTTSAAPAAPFADVPQTLWFTGYVNYAYDQGIVGGKSATAFAPGDDITRGEMAKIAIKTYDLP